MRRHRIDWVIAGLVIATATSIGFARARLEGVGPGTQAAGSSFPPSALARHRSSSSDLELGGELAGLPPGSTRFVTRNDLLTLPQVEYTVTDDANFTRPTHVSGVALDELVRYLASPRSGMVVAICEDQYQASYPRAYIEAHHPLLILRIDGQGPPGWPKDAEGHGLSMGPFMISHPRFTPSFKIFSHADEAQIPWGVVRIEFRNEQETLRTIAPRGPHADDQLVQAGYRIAQQNCFRCHNQGNQGGTKAGRPWLVLAAWAATTPEYFAAYVRNPRVKNPQAQMPGNAGYDDNTIAALRAYFQTLSPSGQGAP
jgi:mono/diheme cytochrome c family protein